MRIPSNNTELSFPVPCLKLLWFFCFSQEDGNSLQERKYIVSRSALLQLFLICSICYSKCSILKLKTCGFILTVITSCANGHFNSWESGQKSNGRLPVCGLSIAASTFFSGASVTKLCNVLKFANILTMCRSTFYKLQKCYVIPSVRSVWQFEQSKVIRSLTGKKVKLAGDGRCCSPGHTAKYGSYTLMDAETGKILATELIQVWFFTAEFWNSKFKIYIFMPPPFEEWWRGIKRYPCLCVRAFVRPSEIWCPLNNF